MNTYQFRQRGAHAIGRPTGDGDKFVVFAGAKVATENAEAFDRNDSLAKRIRQFLLDERIIRDGVLTVDYTFPSKSCAACVIGGSYFAGPQVWEQYP